MNYDVVVVGAGPAGSTAAKILAEHHVNVLLLDASTFPREKPCGGGLPTRVWKRYSYVQPLLDSISFGSHTYSSSLQYVLKIDRNEPLLGMVIRKEFDQRLVDIAVKQGVTFHEGTPVVDVRVNPSKVEVILENGDLIEARAVLGCDGMRSVVAEKTGLSEKNQPPCICLVQEQPLTKTQMEKHFSKKRVVHLFIKTQDIAGYGWVFPKNNLVNIGIGEFSSALDPTKPKKNLKESYEHFIEILKHRNLLPQDFPMENLKGGLLPIFPLKKTYAERVLLCGDAAGFINPITGEGIYYAMRSGELAADVLRKGLQAKDLSAQFLSCYQSQWKQEFGKDLQLLGRFNKQWGKNSEKIVRFMTIDKTLAKMTVGITGGSISFSRYLPLLFLRYLYVLVKDRLMIKK